MAMTLRPVKLEDREILANLLEKYDYEFSQYDRRDVNRLGLYGYEYLDDSAWYDANQTIVSVFPPYSKFLTVHVYKVAPKPFTPESLLRTETM